jgi:hypothetical protein
VVVVVVVVQIRYSPVAESSPGSEFYCLVAEFKLFA